MVHQRMCFSASSLQQQGQTNNTSRASSMDGSSADGRESSMEGGRTSSRVAEQAAAQAPRTPGESEGRVLGTRIAGHTAIAGSWAADAWEWRSDGISFHQQQLHLGQSLTQLFRMYRLLVPSHCGLLSADVAAAGTLLCRLRGSGLALVVP